MTTSAPEEFSGRLAPGKDWTEIVAMVSDLPPLPHVAAQAISLVEDPDTTAGQLTSLLGKDTALAARVLKIANSAMFSMQREITTLNQAIMIIGFKALKGVIVAATLRQLNRTFGKLEQLIWENSTCTAIGAYNIAQQLKKPFLDEVFLIGLLHDLGKLVMVRELPKEYQKVIDLTKAGKTFVEAEQEILGFSHPLIGALVAKKWNFPLEACQIILHSHDPFEAPVSNSADEKTLVIQYADSIAHIIGHGHLPGYPDLTEKAEECRKLLNVPQELHERLFETVKTAFSEQASAYN
jgi:HD-like signal output (HDOD) protein